jgi:hypothetical protein
MQSIHSTWFRCKVLILKRKPQNMFWGFSASITILPVGVELIGQLDLLDWRGILGFGGLTGLGRKA